MQQQMLQLVAVVMQHHLLEVLSSRVISAMPCCCVMPLAQRMPSVPCVATSVTSKLLTACLRSAMTSSPLMMG